MTTRGWFFVVIGLILGISAMAILPAEAQIKWRGFSELCFEGTFRSGSVTKGDLTIKLTGINIETSCLVLGSQQSCQPGSGNAGDITLTVPASADPTKEKGTISAEGCISLDRWDHHFLDNGQPAPPEVHTHTCNPLSNLNKVEIPDSAHVDSITTEWILTNNGKVIQKGNQECFWPGTIDPDSCTPVEHGLEFVCPIDVVSGKGNK